MVTHWLREQMKLFLHVLDPSWQNGNLCPSMCVCVIFCDRSQGAIFIVSSHSVLWSALSYIHCNFLWSISDGLKLRMWLLQENFDLKPSDFKFDVGFISLTRLHRLVEGPGVKRWLESDQYVILAGRCWYMGGGFTITIIVNDIWLTIIP